MSAISRRSFIAAGAVTASTVLSACRNPGSGKGGTKDTAADALVSIAFCLDYEFAIESPEEAAQILCKAVSELDADLVTQSQTYLADQYRADAKSWGVIDGERWARFCQWLNENDLVESKLGVNAGWTAEYL